MPTILILIIMGHIGGSVVVCITLPLAVLFSFILMRFLGVPSNIMSLSGIAISIGVLVDSSIVMVENASHRLGHKFAGGRVTGDTREEIIAACQTVGRPIFFSVLIMLISVANHVGVDLERAFRAKEKENETRQWS